MIDLLLLEEVKEVEEGLPLVELQYVHMFKLSMKVEVDTYPLVAGEVLEAVVGSVQSLRS